MRLLKHRMLLLLFNSLLILLILNLIYILRPLWLSLYQFIKVVGLPFFISVIIAYLLHPVVHLLVRIGLRRGWALGLIYGIFFIGLGLAGYLLIPELILQGKELNERLPQMIATFEKWVEMYQDQEEHWPQGLRKGISNGFQKFENGISDWIGRTIDGFGDMMNNLMNLTLVPFLVFYILNDYDHFLEKVIRFLPRKYRKPVLVTMRNINEGIGDYVSGQLLVSLVLGILIYVGYLLIGFPYPLVFGLIAMIFNLVPYLGPFLGAIPAMLIALTLSWKLTLLVALVNTIGQTIENNLLSPFIVGKTTQLHPLAIIFALLVGGELGGIVGMILAVPLLVMGKEILIQVSQSMIHHPASSDPNP
ncbi:AI-2E family transporter [Thermicanus aegyptius]|uniref:AI-2E family transporter n=1 Tax=Thermicanus aegyptius TaxID=94009 RepID=UPI0003FA3C98|nr:AI-2E family transporter [Thermicanus aegyptius]